MSAQIEMDNGTIASRLKVYRMWKSPHSTLRVAIALQLENLKGDRPSIRKPERRSPFN
jgi:hypothetical protein